VPQTPLLAGLALAATLAVLIQGSPAVAEEKEQVTPGTFIRAESDRMFHDIAKQAGGVNRLFHFRRLTPLDRQTVTVYGTDNKLLIPNEKKVYDRTTYSAKQNEDGTYTITLSPTGEGLNGIPTGKPFHAILRVYVPVKGADLTVKVRKR